MNLPVLAGVIAVALLALTGCQNLPGSGDGPQRTGADRVVLTDDNATLAGPEPTTTWTLSRESARQQVRNPRNPEIVHDDVFDLTETEWDKIQDRTEAYLAAEEAAMEVHCTDSGSYTVETSGWQSEKITRSDCGDIDEKQDLFEYVNDLATARAGPVTTVGDRPRIRLAADSRNEIEVSGSRITGNWNDEPVDVDLTVDQRSDVDRSLTQVLRSDESSCPDGSKLRIMVPTVRDSPWVGAACRNGPGGRLLNLFDELITK